jgi:hypothetical protein
MQNKQENANKTTPGFMREIVTFLITIAVISMLAAFGLFVIINEIFIK